MRTTHHQYPSRTSGIATVCGFSICYILWVCWVHHVTGVWVYPLLEYISPLAKIVFFLLVTVIINIYYVLGEKLNSYIWDLDKSMEAADKTIKVEWFQLCNSEKFCSSTQSLKSFCPLYSTVRSLSPSQCWGYSDRPGVLELGELEHRLRPQVSLFIILLSNWLTWVYKMKGPLRYWDILIWAFSFVLVVQTSW